MVSVSRPVPLWAGWIVTVLQRNRANDEDQADKCLTPPLSNLRKEEPARKAKSRRCFGDFARHSETIGRSDGASNPYDPLAERQVLSILHVAKLMRANVGMSRAVPKDVDVRLLPY